ncbi:DUF5667 domain-containing protein [Orenia marismortui]|uniref:DUF5667 domain-containing protein n=1 Tax=Orenia marismortui TaxID=46469 RepID=A0A4V3GYI7_9FIRM|nr:DUF5667 domain-containing protein [Orenia marismortui]TDX52314.1 hypothetical protein C7959_10721 [Orenia marismortui]
MKNRIVIITLILILSSTFVASNSWAKEDSSFENKIKADSPFYFLDRLGEKIGLLLTPTEEKAKVKFQHAYERLLESKEMLNDDKDDKAKELFKEGLSNLSEGISLTRKNIINDEEIEEIKEEIKSLGREISKLISQKELSIKSIKNNIKQIFDK